MKIYPILNLSGYSLFSVKQSSFFDLQHNWLSSLCFLLYFFFILFQELKHPSFMCHYGYLYLLSLIYLSNFLLRLLSFNFLIYLLCKHYQLFFKFVQQHFSLNKNSASFLDCLLKTQLFVYYIEYLLPTDMVKWLQYSDCTKVA